MRTVQCILKQRLEVNFYWITVHCSEEEVEETISSIIKEVSSQNIRDYLHFLTAEPHIAAGPRQVQVEQIISISDGLRWISPFTGTEYWQTGWEISGPSSGWTASVWTPTISSSPCRTPTVPTRCTNNKQTNKQTNNKQGAPSGQWRQGPVHI